MGCFWSQVTDTTIVYMLNRNQLGCLLLAVLEIVSFSYFQAGRHYNHLSSKQSVLVLSSFDHLQTLLVSKYFIFFFFSFKPSVRRLIQCFNTFMSQNPKFSASHGSAIFPDFFYVTSFPTAFLHYVGGRASLVESTKKTDGFSFIRQHRPYTKDKCNSL